MFLMENQHKTVDIIIKNEKRSINQNSYLHLLFGLFGLEFGLTLDESKQLIKYKFLSYKKKGKDFVKQTSKLDTKEMTIFIEKFRKFSSENSCYLPGANEKENLNSFSESASIKSLFNLCDYLNLE